jgi:hypothetical protein
MGRTSSGRQSDDRLGELVACHGIQQEQRADTGEGVAQRFDVEEVALCNLDTFREAGLGGIAGQNTDAGAAPGELCDSESRDPTQKHAVGDREGGDLLVLVQEGIAVDRRGPAGDRLGRRGRSQSQDEGEIVDGAAHRLLRFLWH